MYINKYIVLCYLHQYYILYTVVALYSLAAHTHQKNNPQPSLYTSTVCRLVIYYFLSHPALYFFALIIFIIIIIIIIITIIVCSLKIKFIYLFFAILFFYNRMIVGCV